MRTRSRWAALLLTSVAATAAAQVPGGGRGYGPDTMPVVHTVRSSTIRVDDGGIATIEIDPTMRYVGAHRFVLYGVADAEQHAFATADASGNVLRFYWIQFERYLPTATNGRYTYDQDSLIVRDGLEWRVQGRRYTSPPDSTGDRGAFYALLAKAGLRAPSGAARVRLVHLMSDDRRSEIMIIYAEASSAAGGLSRDELAQLIGRAQVGLHVTRR
jgi:hypothetical protein